MVQRSKWEALPADLKVIVTNCIKGAEVAYHARLISKNEKAVQGFKDKGVIVDILPSSIDDAFVPEATKYLKPTLAIPYHWGSVVGTKADADKFVALAACNAKAMTVGETISSADWSKDFSMAAYWKLDETAGDVARDDSGGNHATLNGGPVWKPADGKVGGALELDGVDDYVNVPHKPILCVSLSGSICALVALSSSDSVIPRARPSSAIDP